MAFKTTSSVRQVCFALHIRIYHLHISMEHRYTSLYSVYLITSIFHHQPSPMLLLSHFPTYFHVQSLPFRSLLHTFLKIYLKTANIYNCSLTNNPAIPCPVPIHILVNKILFFCRLHSLSPVQICLAPVAPSGCPSAIAPPLTFIFE